MTLRYSFFGFESSSSVRIWRAGGVPTRVALGIQREARGEFVAGGLARHGAGEGAAPAFGVALASTRRGELVRAGDGERAGEGERGAALGRLAHLRRNHNSRM